MRNEGQATEWVAMMREILADQVIPAVCRDGVQRLRLPQDFGPDDWLPPDPWGPQENRHPQPDLCCFLAGLMPLWIEDHLIAFRAGDLLLLPPHVKHWFSTRVWYHVPRVSPSAAPTVLWLSLHPFGAAVRLCQTLGEVVVCTPYHFLSARGISQAGRALVLEMTERPEGYATIARGLLLEILGRVRGAPLLVGLETGPPAPEASADGLTTPDLVKAAKEYMYYHHMEHLYVADVARHLFVSASHLRREFRRRTGRTVMSYLNEMRIAAAKSLLETSLPVARVAKLVGFADPLYFSRVFRHQVGQSPSRFRARLLSEGQRLGAHDSSAGVPRTRRGSRNHLG